MTKCSSKTTFGLEYAQLSDLGLRRLNNQDAVAAVVAADRSRWKSRGHFLMVADGMGAHAAGELASKLAVDNIPHAYFKRCDLSPPAALRQAFRQTNELIHAKGQSSLDFQGMGTTCSSLVLLPEGALIAHVGDSRIYRLRGTDLKQLTFDHSLVWEMASAGQTTEESVPAYIPKNVITRSLGPHPTINVDLEGPYDVQIGDVFLLCSDGLSGPLDDKEIGVILGCLPPQDAAQTLVDLANLRGGPDNISVVIGRICEEPDSGRQELQEGAEQPSPPRARVHPAVWAGCLVCLLALIASSYAAVAPGVLVASLGLGAMVALALIQWLNHRVADRVHALGGPYGNGPYREFESAPTTEMTGALAEIAERLQQLAGDEKSSIDWEPLKQKSRHAAEAAAAGDLRAAIVDYSAGIRHAMQQLRQKHGPDMPQIDLG